MPDFPALRVCALHPVTPAEASAILAYWPPLLPPVRPAGEVCWGVQGREPGLNPRLSTSASPLRCRIAASKHAAVRFRSFRCKCVRFTQIHGLTCAFTCAPSKSAAGPTTKATKTMGCGPRVQAPYPRIAPRRAGIPVCLPLSLLPDQNKNQN